MLKNYVKNTLEVENHWIVISHQELGQNKV